MPDNPDVALIGGDSATPESMIAMMVDRYPELDADLVARVVHGADMIALATVEHGGMVGDAARAGALFALLMASNIEPR